MIELRKIYRNEFYKDLRSWLHEYRDKHGGENLTDDDIKEISGEAVEAFHEEINAK